MSLKDQAREIDREQSKKDLRNGALTIAAFIALPFVLSEALGTGTIFVALIPLVFGVILCIRGGLGLARTSDR